VPGQTCQTAYPWEFAVDYTFWAFADQNYWLHTELDGQEYDLYVSYDPAVQCAVWAGFGTCEEMDFYGQQGEPWEGMDFFPYIGLFSTQLFIRILAPVGVMVTVHIELTP